MEKKLDIKTKQIKRQPTQIVHENEFVDENGKIKKQKGLSKNAKIIME